MRGYPQFSFWISITLVKIYISCTIVNWGQNTFELVGTVLKQFFQGQQISGSIHVFKIHRFHLSKKLVKYLQLHRHFRIVFTYHFSHRSQCPDTSIRDFSVLCNAK